MTKGLFGCIIIKINGFLRKPREIYGSYRKGGETIMDDRLNYASQETIVYKKFEYLSSFSYGEADLRGVRVFDDYIIFRSSLFY